jgi:hypothetical protein
MSRCHSGRVCGSRSWNSCWHSSGRRCWRCADMGVLPVFELCQKRHGCAQGIGVTRQGVVESVEHGKTGQLGE